MDVHYVGGQTGTASNAIQLLRMTARQVQEVAAFRPTPRDLHAPRMERASTVRGTFGSVGQNLDLSG